MGCKLRRFTAIGVEEYTCSEVRKLKADWLKEYRVRNRSDELRVDKSSERYEKEIDEFLSSCKCVGEKIREAKERRDRGDSPWKSATGV